VRSAESELRSERVKNKFSEEIRVLRGGGKTSSLRKLGKKLGKLGG